ncbi:MAG: glycosyltransferase family 9 protein [Lentimicrobiaceae bacterium]
MNKQLLSRILIIQTASLGDVILSTSLAETLHSEYPVAKIDYLIKAGYEDLFAGHPFIGEILTWNKSNRKYANLFKLALKVRHHKYDAVINIQRFASSGFISALSGAKFRSGFVKNPFAFTYTHKADHIILNKPGSPHEIYRNAKLIEPLTSIKALRPRLYPSVDDNMAVRKWQGKPYITISPASLYYTKQFPEYKWVELITNISSAFSVRLLGSKADDQLCQKIMKESKHNDIINLSGQLSFLQSALMMQNAVMNYVNDSAPQHIASAVNAPVTVVFCSTVPSFGFGPLSDNSTVVETTEQLSCKPCGLHGYQECPEGHFKCAETIALSQMLTPLTYGQRDKD